VYEEPDFGEHHFVDYLVKEEEVDRREAEKRIAVLNALKIQSASGDDNSLFAAASLITYSKNTALNTKDGKKSIHSLEQRYMKKISKDVGGLLERLK